MIHPCPQKCVCLPDNPLANLTSEGPDVDLFLAAFFGWNAQHNPNLGTCAINPSDPQFCHSNDPLAASVCANNQWYQQYVNDWNTLCKETPQPTPPPPGPPPPGIPYVPPVVPPTTTPPTPQLLYNQLVSCAYTCPDGLLFNWTTLPGYVSNTDQYKANQLASQIACQKASANYCCFTSGVFMDGQVSVPYVDTVSVKGKVPPYSFNLVSGQVPPGLQLVPLGTGTDIQLIGTPTTAGNFTFMLQATDKFGHFMAKQFTVTITGTTPVADCDRTFSNPPWVVGNDSWVGGGSHGTASGPDFTFTMEGTSSPNYPSGGRLISFGYGAPAVVPPLDITLPETCHLNLTITKGGVLDGEFSFTIQWNCYGDSGVLYDSGGGVAPGTHTYAFTLPYVADWARPALNIVFVGTAQLFGSNYTTGFVTATGHFGP
jgi:hypothetical protein